ncbi:MAG: hypothetical protein ACMUIS_11765 [bacterium]
MRYKTLCVALALIASVMSGKVRAETDKPDTSSEILYFEDYIEAIEEEPESRFHRAREFFFKNDMQAAAKEIRKGAVFLRLESGWATKEGKGPLIASSQELEKLADDLESDSVTSVKALDDTFARAHYALARHYHLKAAESHGKQAYKKLARELKAAAKHLKHALLWSRNKIESVFNDLMRDIHSMAERLTKDEKQAHDEVGNVIDSIGNEIEKSRERIEPGKK